MPDEPPSAPPIKKADLIFHPVRMRIVLATVGRRVTARQLAAALPEVPQATLYHHLGRLTRAGLLEVVAERPVRGTVERVYALPEGAGQLAPEELRTASRDELMRYFTTFVASLLGEFGAYLRRERIDPLADGVGFRQVPLYLSDAELAELSARLNAVLLPALAHQPGPGRSRRVLTSIVLPADEGPDAGGSERGPAARRAGKAAGDGDGDERESGEMEEG